MQPVVSHLLVSSCRTYLSSQKRYKVTPIHGDFNKSVVRGVMHAVAEEIPSTKHHCCISACDTDPMDFSRNRFCEATDHTFFGGAVLGGAAQIGRLIICRQRGLDEFQCASEDHFCSTLHAQMTNSKMITLSGLSCRKSVPNVESARVRLSAFVTGGMGALGQLTSAWCVSRGYVRKLVLAGRSGRTQSFEASMRFSSSLTCLVCVDIARSEDADFGLDDKCNLISESRDLSMLVTRGWHP
jgi:hypothetical protein